MTTQAKIGISVAAVIVLAGVGGGAWYMGHKTDSAATGSVATQNTSTASKVDLEKVMAAAKTQFPTATVTKVYTEQTDPNNLLGKPGEYVAGAAFLDTRTETQGDEWGADGGGGVEVFASKSDAEKRVTYFDGLSKSGSALLSPGAYKQVGVVVVRASSSLTKSQQDEVINFLASQVN